MPRRELQKKLEALRPRLYRLAWAWCHERDLADELTQAAYARALGRLDALRNEDRLEAWMCAILANLWKDHLRRRQRELERGEPEAFPDRCDESEGDPEVGVQAHEIVRQVRNAVARLGPDHRMVITLVDLMDMSYADVSRILDVPAGTVMSRLSRARAKLKGHLEGFQRGSAGASAQIIPLRRRA